MDTTAVVLAVVLIGLLYHFYFFSYRGQSFAEHLSLAPEWSCKHNNPTAWPAIRKQLLASQAAEERKKVVIFVAHNYHYLPYYAMLAIRGYKAYAQRHSANTTFEEVRSSPFSLNISPYWLRVREFQKFCEKLPEGAIVAYCDLDTMIKPAGMQFSLDRILDVIDKRSGWKWDIYAGCDPFEHGIFAMNSGVVIVRNTSWTRQFIAAWLDMYPKEAWSKDVETQQWECFDKKSKGKCAWAQMHYEQGTLNKLWQDNELRAKEHICRVHRTVFSEFEPATDAFMVHLMRGKEDYRSTVFQQFLTASMAAVPS